VKPVHHQNVSPNAAARPAAPAAACAVGLTAAADDHPGALEYTRSGVTRTAARRSSAITRS
jgi:hypothetical protein